MIPRTFLRWFLSASLTVAPLAPYGAVWAQGPLNLPQPGVMVGLSAPYNPPVFRGLTVDPQTPFTFQFIMDTGDEPYSEELVTELSERLSRYFLASLTIPEEDLWVNLSPYESDRIVPEALGRTQMGRDMLAQDYILKQISASLLHPDEELGAAFWERVRQEAYVRFGTTDIPVETVNKIWIIPDYADVYEDGNTVVILDAHLKVLLEEDYKALEQMTGAHGNDAEDGSTANDVASLSTQILREIIIPALEEEVNTGKHFTELRQIYHALILAAWYKEALLNSVLARVYADKERTEGVNVDDPEVQQKIYAQYLKAFEKGVYNFIKEDWDEQAGEVIPRKYFSGGANMQVEGKIRKHSPDSGSSPTQGVKGFLALSTVALGLCSGGCSTTPIDQSGGRSDTAEASAASNNREAYNEVLTRADSSLSDADISLLISQPMRLHLEALPRLLNPVEPSEASINNLARMASQSDDSELVRLLVNRILSLGRGTYRDNPGPIASGLAKQNYAALTTREQLDSARFLLSVFYHPQVVKADVVNVLMDIMAANFENTSFLENVIPEALAMIENREVTDTSVYSREVVNLVLQAASGLSPERQRELAPRLEAAREKVLLNPFQGLMGRWDVASYDFDEPSGKLHLNSAIRIPSKRHIVEPEFLRDGKNLPRFISLDVQPFDMWQDTRFSEAQQQELRDWMQASEIPLDISLYSIQSTESARFHRIYGAAADGAIFLRQEIFERGTVEQIKEALFHEYYELRGLHHEAIRESQGRIFSEDGGLSKLIHAVNREDKVYLASLAERMTLESLEGVQAAVVQGNAYELTDWLSGVTDLSPYIGALTTAQRQTFFKTLIDVRHSAPALAEKFDEALGALLAPEVLPFENRVSLAMEIRNDPAPAPEQYERFVLATAVQTKQAFQKPEGVGEAIGLLRILTPHLARLRPQTRQQIASLSSDVSSLLQEADMGRVNQSSEYEQVHAEMRAVVGFMEELLISGEPGIDSAFQTLIEAEAVDFDIRTMAAESLLSAYGRAVAQRQTEVSGRILETLMEAYPFAERPDPQILRQWLGHQGTIPESQKEKFIADLNAVAGVNAEMGYAMLERVRSDALVLSDVVESTGMNIQARLYAYGLLAGQHRLASALPEELVARAEDFVQEIGKLNGRQLNDRLLNKPFVRDHLRAIGVAGAIVGHRSPKIPTALRDRLSSLAAHMEQIWSIRFLRGYDNATSLYEIGHRLVEQSGDVLVLTILHEQGHNILEMDFGLLPQDLTTQTLHETFADLYAETIAAQLGIPVDAFHKAVRAEEAHRSVVTYFDGISGESHEAGRAQLTALRTAYPAARDFPTDMLMEIMVRHIAMYQNKQLMRPHLRILDTAGWEGPSFYETMRLITKDLAERSLFQVIDNDTGLDSGLARYTPGEARVKIFSGESLATMFRRDPQFNRRRVPPGFLTSILSALGLMGRWQVEEIHVDRASGTLRLLNAGRIVKDGDIEVEPEFMGMEEGVTITLKTRPLSETGESVQSVVEAARGRLGIPRELPIEAIAYDSASTFYRIYGAAADNTLFIREDILREGNLDQITEAVDHEYRELTKAEGVTHDQIRSEQFQGGLSELIHARNEKDKELAEQARRLMDGILADESLFSDQGIDRLSPKDWRIARDIVLDQYGLKNSDEEIKRLRYMSALVQDNVSIRFMASASDREWAVVYGMVADIWEREQQMDFLSEGEIMEALEAVDSWVMDRKPDSGPFAVEDLAVEIPFPPDKIQKSLDLLLESNVIRRQGDGYEKNEEGDPGVGGVDFNTHFLNFQRRGRGSPDFSGITVEDIERMNPTGFVPILLDVKPLPALPLFLSRGDN